MLLIPHLLCVLCSFFNQKEGSFAGRIFYNLRPLSSETTAKNMDLYSHSAKHKRGNLELLLSIKGAVSIPSWSYRLDADIQQWMLQDAEKGSMQVRLKEHKALVTKIVVHESKEVASRGLYTMVRMLTCIL